MQQVDMDLIRSLPKVELHAHLSGSFRKSTLNEVLGEPDHSDGYYLPPLKEYNAEAWKGCVDVFNKIAKASTSGEQNGRRLIREVIEDFANEGTIYLELRIGLKNAPTKQIYLDHLIKEIEAQSERFPSTIVKLIVTMARHNEVAYHKDALEAAIQHHKTYLLAGKDPIVVGVEVAGHPFVGHWRDMKVLFDSARREGLKVTLHCGETKESQEEWKEMLEWNPDRIGHGTFLNEECLDLLRKKQIPVELCLTVARNWFCVPYSESVFHSCHGSVPVVFCTDNTLLNKTSLCKEYAIAMEQFNLSGEKLIEMCRTNINCIFASQKCKERVLQIFEERLLLIKG